MRALGSMWLGASSHMAVMQLCLQVGTPLHCLTLMKLAPASVARCCWCCAATGIVSVAWQVRCSCYSQHQCFHLVRPICLPEIVQ